MVVNLFRMLRVYVVATATLSASLALAQTDTQKVDPPEIKIGDQWKLVQKDARTGLVEQEFARSVTAVSAEQIEGLENGQKLLMTPEMSITESSIVSFSGEVRFLNFPLQVGKKWEYKMKIFNKARNMNIRRQSSAVVEAFEKVKVPAGEFDAYKVQTDGYWNNDTTGRSGSFKMTEWYAPAAKHVVKSTYSDGFNNTVTELTEYKLQ